MRTTINFLYPGAAFRTTLDFPLPQLRFQFKIEVRLWHSSSCLKEWHLVHIKVEHLGQVTQGLLGAESESPLSCSNQSGDPIGDTV